MQASLFERHVASGLTPIASPYIRVDAGTHRYSVGTGTPKWYATTVIFSVRSCGAEIQGSSTSSAKGLLPRSRQKLCLPCLAEIRCCMQSYALLFLRAGSAERSRRKGRASRLTTQLVFKVAYRKGNLRPTRLVHRFDSR